jgi:hypothetical protein
MRGRREGRKLRIKIRIVRSKWRSEKGMDRNKGILEKRVERTLTDCAVIMYTNRTKTRRCMI